MTKKILSILVACSLFFTGCFNYRDINRVLFSTAVLVDIDENENVVTYVEVFFASRVSGEAMGQEERVIHKNTGQTITECLREINEGSSYKINYTQNKAVIFTERAARHGIDNFIDVVERDQESILRQYFFVYPGEPEELLKIEMKEEKYLGLFLEDVSENQFVTSEGVVWRVNDYFNRRLMGSGVELINIIDIDDNPMDERVRLMGLAVLDNDKMVARMNLEEGMAYNFMRNKVKYGVISLSHPDYDKKYVALKIIGSSTKDSISYSNGEVNLTKNILVKVAFGETQKPIDLRDEKVREEIKRNAEEKIKLMCEKLFTKYKEQGIDLVNVKRNMEVKYPKVKMEDVVRSTNLKVNVNVFMKESSDKTNFNPAK